MISSEKETKVRDKKEVEERWNMKEKGENETKQEGTEEGNCTMGYNVAHENIVKEMEGKKLGKNLERE